jgi:hypothetical protein
LAWREGPGVAWRPERVAEAGVLLGVLLVVELWVFAGWEIRGLIAGFWCI